jgi:hypothetical protein
MVRNHHVDELAVKRVRIAERVDVLGHPGLVFRYAEVARHHADGLKLPIDLPQSGDLRVLRLDDRPGELTDKVAVRALLSDLSHLDRRLVVRNHVGDERTIDRVACSSGGFAAAIASAVVVVAATAGGDPAYQQQDPGGKRQALHLRSHRCSP